MKITSIYLIILCLFSCLNRTEELRKIQKEANLCLILSRSFYNGNIDNQFSGYILCINESYKKVQDIDKKDYFKSDDH